MSDSSPFLNFLSKDAVTAGLSAVAKKPLEQITDEIFEGVGRFFSQMVAVIGNLLDVAVSNIFVSTDEFEKNFIGNFGGLTVSPIDVAIRMSAIVGMSLVVMFTVFYIVKYFIFHNELKQTPINMLVKAIFCTFLILNSKTLVGDFIFPAYNSFCEAVMDYGFDGNESTLDGKVHLIMRNGEKDLSWLPGNLMKKEYHDGDAAAKVEIFGVVCQIISIPPMVFFVPLIMLIIAWPILKSMISMFLEMAERYVVTLFLILFAPIFIATAMLQDTENIWKSYVRLITSSSILLIMYLTFFKIGLVGIRADLTYASITGYVMTLAYWKFAKRLDTYMNSMGLNMAQTGSGVMDAISASAANIVRDIARGSELRNAAGQGLKTIGAAVGGSTGKALFQAGSVVGASVMNPIMSASQVNNAFADSVARNGGAPIRLNPKESANMIGQFMRNPKANIDRLKSVAVGDLANGIQHACRDRFGNETLSNINGLEINNDGTLGFKATDQDGNENAYKIGAENEDRMGVLIGDEAQNMSGYLHSIPDGSIQPGESVYGSADDVFRETGALALTDDRFRRSATNIASSDLNSITSATRNKDGSWTYSNAEGKPVAQLSKGNLIQREAIGGHSNTSAKRLSAISNAANSAGISGFIGSNGKETHDYRDAQIQKTGNGTSYVTGISGYGSNRREQAMFIPNGMGNESEATASAIQSLGVANEFMSGEGGSVSWSSNTADAEIYTDSSSGERYMLGRNDGGDSFRIPLTESVPNEASGGRTDDYAGTIMNKLGYAQIEGSDGFMTSDPSMAVMQTDENDNNYFVAQRAGSPDKDKIYVSNQMDNLRVEGERRTFTSTRDQGKKTTKITYTIEGRMKANPPTTPDSPTPPNQRRKFR